MDISLSQISKSQLPLLMSPETPPCISVFIPIKAGEIALGLSSRFTDLFAKAIEHVGVKYGLRQAENLVRAPFRIPWADLIAKSVDKTVAFFISPEVSGFMILEGQKFPNTWRVAEYFSYPGFGEMSENLNQISDQEVGNRVATSGPSGNEKSSDFANTGI